MWYAILSEDVQDSLERRKSARAAHLARLERGLRDARLSTLLADIFSDFRSRYLLSYTLGGIPAPGWHEVDVRVKRRGASVRTRRGYFVADGR